MDRIIDCTNLGEDEEGLDQSPTHNHKQNEEVSLFIPSNVKVVNTYENEETNYDEENLDVVIPEELNKIDDIPNKISQLSERNVNILNYFKQKQPFK